MKHILSPVANTEVLLSREGTKNILGGVAAATQNGQAVPFEQLIAAINAAIADLDGLGNVDADDAITGDVLVFNSVSGNWENQPLTTTNVPEGTNLYYTAARFNTAFSSKSTTDLAEGTNLYYTAARFNTAFSAKSTTDLAEGTNLYYTDARSRASISVAPASQNRLSYNNLTGEFAVTALAITDVHTSAEATLTAFVAAEYTVGNEFQEGDIIILTTPQETYIHNGGVAVTTADFTLIEAPNLSDAYIRGLFSATAGSGLTYTPASGVFALAESGLAANGFLSSVNFTSFNNKIGSLNALTASTQTFATGTTGTDFNISSVTSTHTFNIPNFGGAGTRGFVPDPVAATNKFLRDDGSWQTISLTDTNITTGALTFTVSRTHDLDVYKMIFTGDTTNLFTLDGATDRVGFGISIPLATVHTVGSIRMQDAAQTIESFNVNAASGKIGVNTTTLDSTCFLTLRGTSSSEILHIGFTTGSDAVEIGYDTIKAAGSVASQSLDVRGKGTGGLNLNRTDGGNIGMLGAAGGENVVLYAADDNGFAIHRATGDSARYRLYVYSDGAEYIMNDATTAKVLVSSRTGTSTYFNAGNNVGIGTSTPSSQALLELVSTNKAFLIMRMTATQASAITPASGMGLYVTDTNGTFLTAGFWKYEEGVWLPW